MFLRFLRRNNCIEKNQNQIQIQIGWIFGKVPNGTWPPLLRMVPISGNHVHAFHTIWPSYLLAYMHYATISIIKKLQHNFPKMRGRGSKAIWNFSENSSDLVAGQFPQLHLIRSKKWPTLKGAVFFKTVINKKLPMKLSKLPSSRRGLYFLWKLRPIYHNVIFIIQSTIFDEAKA